MYKKRILGLVLSASFLTATIATPAFADELDNRIAEQKEKIQAIQANETEQSNALSQTLADIAETENKIAASQQALQAIQQQIETLSQDIMTLEELMTKRSTSINNQARFIQTNDTINDFFSALFEADNFFESLSQLLALSELTGASYNQLEKQQQDQQALQQKQTDLESHALTYAQQTADFELLRTDLLEKTAQAQVALTQLALDKASAESDIASLQQQKEEAQRQQEEAQKLINARKEQIAKQQAIQQLQSPPVVAEQAVAVATTQSVTQTQAAPAAAPVQPTAVTTETTQQKPAPATSTAPAVVQNEGFIQPISNPRVTSPFGVARSFTLSNGTPYSDIHNGIDLVNGNNSAPILSVASGTVVWSGYQTAGGNGVIVKLANGLYAHYFHLSSRAVSTGQVVAQGQTIGTMGGTGLYVTGIHLHFGLSTSLYGGYVNPASYIPF